MLSRKSRNKLSINDFDILNTLGTGTFGRVRLVKVKNQPHLPPFALKMLKKTVIIKLKQVEHIKSEKNILERIRHPFIINL